MEAKPDQTPRALTASPGSDTSPVFSPDGRWIAYVAGGDPKDIWYATNLLALIPVGRGPSKPLTQENDVMAAVDHVVAVGVADPDRLGVGGWSYGGILTDFVITKTNRFKAALSGASEVNFLANYGTDHYQRQWEAELGLPWRNTDLWIRLSPWFQVEKIVTPTLIMCGSDDMNVPLLNSEQLYQALRRLGQETGLVIYPGQNHGIRKPSYLLIMEGSFKCFQRGACAMMETETRTRLSRIVPS